MEYNEYPETFEDAIPVLNRELSKRRNAWRVESIPSISFEDIEQIIRRHVFLKFNQYDKNRIFSHFAQRIITNQIKNLLRNHWLSFTSPCRNCPAALPSNLCSIHGVQSSDSCNLLKKWENGKKVAYDIKIPVALCHHSQEVYNLPSADLDIPKISIAIHEKMKDLLKPIEWKVYKILFIDYKSEEDAAKAMGYKNNTQGKSAGLKIIKSIRKIIIVKVKKMLSEEEIDY